jgi:hypothetical protein
MMPQAALKNKQPKGFYMLSKDRGVVTVGLQVQLMCGWVTRYNVKLRESPDTDLFSAAREREGTVFLL